MLNYIKIDLSSEEAFDDLYDEKEFDVDIPPTFVFVPSVNLIRLMIVDGILETHMINH